MDDSHVLIQCSEVNKIIHLIQKKGISDFKQGCFVQFCFPVVIPPESVSQESDTESILLIKYAGRRVFQR